MGFLKSKNKPTNLQYKWVTDTYKPAAEQSMRAGQAGLNTYMGALTGTDNGAGFDQYTRSTGYENIFGEAMRGATATGASRGLLASGSLVRRSQDRAAELAQQNFANYLQQVLAGSQTNLAQGDNYANLVANVAGQRSQRGGFGNAMANLASVGKALGTFMSPSAGGGAGG